MLAFDVLRDPVRRRIVELLAEEELCSGDVVHVIAKEFGISQPAVSHQLKVLRESGFASVRTDAQRRIYELNPEPFEGIEEWLEKIRGFWDHKLNALETEVARGKRQRKSKK